MEERRTTDDVFSLLSDCMISSSQESLLDEAPWDEPPPPTTTTDAVVMLSPPETQGGSQGGPHEAQSPPTTTPEVIDILSSPEYQGDPHEAQSPPPTTADVVIILSSPESQCGSRDAFHTPPEEPSPADDIDVNQCLVNRAVIDVEESDSSDEARELMAPLFSELGFSEPEFDRAFVTESSHAAECRRLDDDELEVSERERDVNKRMKFSEGAETNFGANLQPRHNEGAEASDVADTRFVLVEPSDVVETRFVLVEPSFLENPRKEIRFPIGREEKKKTSVAFDVLKALAEYDKDDLCGMDLVEAAKRM